MRLGEKSSAACAMATWRDQLYLAWTGSDVHLNMARSPDGRAIAGKKRLNERSYTVTQTSSGTEGGTAAETIPLAPALAVSSDRIYLAWTGGDAALNVLSTDQGALTPVTLEERSGDSPSLAATGIGTLVLAWTGTDRHVNLLSLAAAFAGDPLPMAGAKTRLEVATSGHAPAVCGHQGSLVLAWTGSDRHINVLTLAEDSPGMPVPLAGPDTRLEDAKSGHAPALCSHQGSVVLAWTGSDRHINVRTLTAGAPGTPVRLDAKSDHPPALCGYRDGLMLAWSGTDRHINLERLS